MPQIKRNIYIYTCIYTYIYECTQMLGYPKFHLQSAILTNRNVILITLGMIPFQNCMLNKLKAILQKLW